ncbi:MAG: L-rhamnose mutarotase [Ruminococcaceae bacterium]|nr:L-rhamnose mutarotase [Oscillospiraceae bacterium]
MDRFFENAKRRIQYASLKAEKVEEYVALHADPFPEIMYDFRRGNMRNYTIWLLGTELYCYLDTVPRNGTFGKRHRYLG